MHSIRRLVREEAHALREIRLEALRLHPEAFVSTHAHDAARPLSDFEAWITGGGAFGGFVDGRLVGIAALAEQHGHQSHKGLLVSVYVQEAQRGNGLAEALIKAIMVYASERVEQLALGAAATNTRAIRFYRRLGFQAYAVEPRALKVGQTYIDEILMLKVLTGEIAGT